MTSKACDYKSKSLFSIICKKAGLHLKNGTGNNELSVDKAVFQKNIAEAVKHYQGDTDEFIEEFLEGFSEYIEDTLRFHKSLLPTLTMQDCNNARSQIQDSAVRIFLGIDVLQISLVNRLLEKLPEFSTEDDAIFEAGEKANIPHLLLAQFCWLEVVQDSKNLIKMLLDMLDATDASVQSEIINALPAIVEDSDHALLVDKLRELLVSKPHLTVVILDALTCLELGPDVLMQVKCAATQALKTVDAQNLSVVVKFLLRTAGSSDLVEVVRDIHKGLDLSSVAVSEHSSLNKHKHLKKKTGDGHKDCELLLLDTLQSSIHFQRGVADAWFKMIDALKENLTELDLLVLLILHHTSQRKSVEQLVRSKVRSGYISEMLLQKAFFSHSQVLQMQFKSLMSLAEMLLCTPDVSLSYIGGIMYQLAFKSFDSFSKQEIVANLVMHAGSGNADNPNAVLDILSNLVQNHLLDMAPLTVFFKRLLDFHQQQISLLHVRKMFSMLSTLAFSVGQDFAMIKDDLHMVIRKLISNLDPKYLCQGVVAGVMVVSGMGRTSDHGHDLSESRLNDVLNLLNMLRTGSSRHPKAAALFLDELANTVSQGHLHPKIEMWISENMTDTFESSFVVDVENGLSSKLCLPVKAQYCLNQKDESNIVINLFPLIIKEILETKAAPKEIIPSSENIHVACLSSHFRLMQTCEHRQNAGCLESIDALLGCPLYLPEESAYEKLELLCDQEKDAVCSALFHCLNWFREVVNAFATQPDAEMKGKVIERLHDITNVQLLLVRCLTVHTKFCPLDLYGEEMKQGPPMSFLKVKSRKEKKRTGKKRKRALKENETSKDAECNGDITQVTSSAQCEKSTQFEDNVEKSKTASAPDILAAYSHCFRELDLGVFSILQAGPIVQASLDSELNTKRTCHIQIQSAQLQFLLEDLVQKLNHILIAAPSKQNFFAKMRSSQGVCYTKLDQRSPKEVISFVLGILPALCCHLEAASAFFQALVAENEADSPRHQSHEYVQMSTCMHLLLQALLAFFSWNGFGLADNQQLLKDGLGVLVGRVKTAEVDQLSIMHMLQGAFQYIENFAAIAPSLAVGTTIVRLLSVFASKSDDISLQYSLAGVAQKLLQRNWLAEDGYPEKGAACNQLLLMLVRTWLVSSKDPTQAMETLTGTAMAQLIQSGKNGVSTSFPTLTRFSFPVFLRIVLSELVEKVKLIAPLKNIDNKETREMHLLRWSVAVHILFMAVGAAKEFNSRLGISACLKYGRMFVEAFLHCGMPVLDANFTAHSTDVHSLLRTLQQSTRILQNMCGHAKRAQDIVQVNQVPVLKRALEKLVLRVKQMLTLNHCQRAFWLGNLKNKTLQGVEILSQLSSPTQNQIASSHNREEEEIKSASDEESEVEMDTSEKPCEAEADPNESKESSCSEVF